MKELFDKLKRVRFGSHIDYLVDTCFVVYIFENQLEKKFFKFIQEKVVAITSFNTEELNHIRHHLDSHALARIRHFLKHAKFLYVLDVPVHPGNPAKEHEFVKSVLPQLDKMEHDPSDAVLLAAAIKAKADVLTRDKHDIFYAKLQNFANDYGVKLLNNMP